RKNEPELLKKIDSAIAAIIANGTYKKIESHYFNFDVYGANPAK
ncbi:transporter substrate-binding domain-containing protein, partial [Acidocella sp.]